LRAIRHDTGNETANGATRCTRHGGIIFLQQNISHKKRHFLILSRRAAAVFFSSMTSYDGLSVAGERPLSGVATAFSNPV
jgi:hypothetical protein